MREQGGTTLQDSIKNVSGDVGGPATQNYFDRSTRGMDARIYNHGFSEGDQINGIPHSLNGVAQIEVLKGPGSALLGSGPGGGSINIVHYEPSAVPHYGVGVQISDFGTLSTNVYATGPSIVPGVNYRVDALVENTDGFRDLKGSSYEFRPTVSDWPSASSQSARPPGLERTPDPFGIIYNPATGQPFNVSRDNKYYSPFSFANQDLERTTWVTYAYTVNKYLTINNRFSYTHRDLDILRDGGLGGGDGSGGGNGGGNGGAGSIKGTALTGRTIREQTDHIDDVNYAFEPVWKFATGSVRHTLVTGAQVQYVSIDTSRATADLPNIDNIFAPEPHHAERHRRHRAPDRLPAPPGRARRVGGQRDGPQHRRRRRDPDDPVPRRGVADRDEPLELRQRRRRASRSARSRWSPRSSGSCSSSPRSGARSCRR